MSSLSTFERNLQKLRDECPHETLASDGLPWRETEDKSHVTQPYSCTVCGHRMLVVQPVEPKPRLLGL